MCTKTLIIFLLILCLLLFGTFWLVLETENLEQERFQLQLELRELEDENQMLLQQLDELKAQQAQLGQRMENWLDEWDVQEAEVTAYAPLDPRAVEGMCYSGDPNITTSGAKTTPGVTVAAPPNIPFGTRMYIPSRGMRIVQDRGPAINYTKDGVMQLDICVETQEEALNEIGRRKILAVIER